MKKKNTIKENYSNIFLKKISALPGYKVLETKKNYLIVCCFPTFKLNIEKNDNIFQPFSKEIEKALPIVFPIQIEGQLISKKDLIVYEFHQQKIPVIILGKEQKDLTEQEIEELLQYHIKKISGDFDNFIFD